MHVRLEDLPPRMREQALAQMAPKPQTASKPPSKPASGSKGRRAVRMPTETENAYKAAFCASNVARFEGLTIRLANGHRYTPDWTYFGPDGRLTCVEVKGAYRLPSYSRARLAFDQARVEWPEVRFVWAEMQKDGQWRVE